MVSKDEMQRKMQQTHALRQAIAGTLAGQDSVAVLRDILAAYECQAESHEGEPAGEQAEIWAAALRRAIASLQAQGAAAVGAAEWSMTRAQVEQWIDACNHGPAREALRHYLRLREAALATPSAPSDDWAECALALSNEVLPPMQCPDTPDRWLAAMRANRAEVASLLSDLRSDRTARLHFSDATNARIERLAATPAVSVGDAKDAERYRWLRERAKQQPKMYGGHQWYFPTLPEMRGGTLDAAIDAAIASKGDSK